MTRGLVLKASSVSCVAMVLAPDIRPGSADGARSAPRAPVWQGEWTLARVTDPAPWGAAPGRMPGSGGTMRTLTNPRSAHDRRTLEERAVALRAAPTRSEELLWRALRGRQLGVTFRRQVLIGRYIVDFAAPARRLVVEVDGSFHVGSRRLADAQRDAALSAAGYRVLRLEVRVVLTQLTSAVERIRAAL